MIDYRRATPDDAPLLSALGQRSFTETFGHLYRPEDLALFLEKHSPDNWRRELSSPDFAVRLAMAGEQAAGYAKVGPPSLPFDVTGPSAELRQLYVLKPWQGEGVAATLMDWAIAEVRARGAEEMYLSVFIDNHRARRFYTRYGFVEVGTYHFMVGDHADDDIIMQLKLNAAG